MKRRTEPEATGEARAEGKRLGGPNGKAWRDVAKRKILAWRLAGVSPRVMKDELKCAMSTVYELLKQVQTEQGDDYDNDQRAEVAMFRARLDSRRGQLNQALAQLQELKRTDWSLSARLPAITQNLTEIDRLEMDALTRIGRMLPEGRGSEVDLGELEGLSDEQIDDLVAEEFVRQALNRSPRAAIKALLAAKSAKKIKGKKGE